MSGTGCVNFQCQDQAWRRALYKDYFMPSGEETTTLMEVMTRRLATGDGGGLFHLLF